MTNRKSEHEKKASIGQANVLVIGDSLASGFGSIPGFFRYLEGELNNMGWSVDMRSRAVPGAGSDVAPYFARSVITDGDIPDVVVIALGTNDMVCAISSERVRAHLDEAVSMFKGEGASVVLSGALVPLNEGGEYADEYDEMYASLAKEHAVQLKPCINEALLADEDRRRGYELFKPELMSDSIHPNRAGAKAMAVDLAKDIDRALIARFIKKAP